MEKTIPEILSILGVNRNAFMAIKRRGTLKERLIKSGYIYKGEFKKGRNVIYIVDKVDEGTIEYCKHFTKKKFNISNDKFPRYYLDTIKSCNDKFPPTILEKANKLKLSRGTIKSWDDTLEDKNILINKQYIYELYNNSNKVKIEISEEDYKIIYAIERSLASKNDNEKNFEKGLIDYKKYSIIKNNFETQENTLCMIVNKCLDEAGITDIKKKVSIVRQSKIEEECLRKLYSYRITRRKKYSVNKRNKTHKEAMVIYSKIEKEGKKIDCKY